MVVACYVSFAALGWFLNGFGSILPDLEDDIGRRASIYPLLPGAVMLVSGIFVVRRHRTVEPRSDYERGIVAGSIALAVSLAVMGVTRWQWVSAIGALAAAIAAAYLVRLLPAVLATIRATDTERVMMRSNAYASVAAISAPLAVGASIALGAGWAPGMVLPLIVGAVVVVVMARPTPADGSRQHHTEHAAGRIPPLATWWREWAVLTMSIVVEFCFVYFAATYLHDELGLSTAQSAAGAAAWGIGMATGRFAVSTWPPPRSCGAEHRRHRCRFLDAVVVRAAGDRHRRDRHRRPGCVAALSEPLDGPARPLPHLARSGFGARDAGIGRGPRRRAGDDGRSAGGLRRPHRLPRRASATRRPADPRPPDGWIYPRPTNGIPAAITVIVSTLVSGGRLAM